MKRSEQDTFSSINIWEAIQYKAKRALLEIFSSCICFQEEMARLQDNIEKLKAQGSEDDGEEKVRL